jgi:hypothetical protein
MARYLCQACGFLGRPTKELRGSPALELILWLALVVPGAIYAWWRSRVVRWRCARCGSALVVPEDSPAARQRLASMPAAPVETLPRLERASRVAAAIPLAGGVGVVFLFGLSIAFPGVREQPWLGVAAYAVAIAILGRPLWTAVRWVLRASARKDRSR